MRSGAPSRRSTRPKGRLGCVVILRFAWSRCWPSRGSSTSIRRSSRSMVIRKARCWATIPRSRGVRAIAITPIRWLRRAWSSMSTSLPATSMRPNTARQACGRFSTVCRATSCATLLRGDRGFGNEEIMREAEARRLPYLLKLRLTANVKRMIEKLASAREWVDAGQGFEAKESEVRLTGWSRKRRVIVLRRRLKDAVGLSLSDEGGAPRLAFVEIGEATGIYEYSVLATSLDEDTEAFGQLYRDRGDGENIFDEMKNQWVARNAEPLTRLQTWRAILSRAFQAFLNGRLLRPPPRPASPQPDATQTRNLADR